MLLSWAHVFSTCFQHVFSACQEMICKVQAIPICCPAVWLQCWDGPLLQQIPSPTPCWYRKWSSAECGSAMAFWCWRPFVAGMVLYIYTHTCVCVCVFMVASVGFMASGGFSCDPMIIPIIHLNHILSRFPEAFEAEVVLQSARCFCRCFGPIVMDLIELFLWSEVGPPAPSGLRVFKVGGFSKVFTTFKWGLHMS